MLGEDSRGVVDFVDVWLTLTVLVGLMVTAPYYYAFTGMASAEADPFSSLLLQLIVPFLFLGLIVSIGVSARGGG